MKSSDKYRKKNIFDDELSDAPVKTIFAIFYPIQIYRGLSSNLAIIFFRNELPGMFAFKKFCFTVINLDCEPPIIKGARTEQKHLV